MRLYSGSSKQFVADTARNQISEKLKESFFNHYRFKPSPAEVNSWRASLSAMAHVFQVAELMDHGVALEYQLPLTSRLSIVWSADGMASSRTTPSSLSSSSGVSASSRTARTWFRLGSAVPSATCYTRPLRSGSIRGTWRMPTRPSTTVVAVARRLPDGPRTDPDVRANASGSSLRL